jgi:hypothetical protein
MEGIPSGPCKEMYPKIEAGVTIRWNAPAKTTGMSSVDSVTTIQEVYVDEEGYTQVVVVDTHKTTPNGAHTIEIQDLYERLDFQDYTIL